MVMLNAGCGTHYASGWVNVDVWEDEHTHPDVRINVGDKYPFDDNTFDAVFLGHVIEHMPWTEVPVFLEDMFRVAKPGAPVLIVGPDVYRTIQRWAKGQEPWHMVVSTLEHQDVNYQPDREAELWEGAAHYWNCHEERVAKLLTAMGKTYTSYSDTIPNDALQKEWFDPVTNVTWPVVGKYFWQFALLTYA